MLDVWYSLAPTAGPLLLSDDERQKQGRLRCLRTASSYGQAHTLKRCLLSRHHPGHGPLSWRFEQGPAGKPTVCAPQRCHFNLSHSGEAIALAVATQEVGVDIECWRPLDEGLALARSVFHVRELRWLESQADFSCAFYRLWTLKEALLKASGEGFSQAPEALCWDDLDAPILAISHAGQRWHGLGKALPGASLAVVLPDLHGLRTATLHELMSRDGPQLHGSLRLF